ncbi:tetraspanin-8 [Dicentrarchus labrax]|uniref:Tetraspanin n=1 Tax=Dicentrarchus labrax TaxID=13489 RepID=A0A8C4IQ40_DICLA|nr:tetraspanin-8 [Dicentrarchus labrax]
MGKVNVCLKRSYIIVTSLIAIISALLLALTLFGHGYHYEHDEIENMLVGIRVMYFFSIFPLFLAIMGVYGACAEKQWALIVFAVGMILSSLFVFASSIRALTFLPLMTKEMKTQYLELLPLANASESTLDNLKETETEWHCCGVFQGYLDWGYNISESCLCAEEPINPCVEAPSNSSLFEHRVDDTPIMIYKEPCAPLIIHMVGITGNITLVVALGFSLLWALSAALCIAILCQLNRKEDVPAVVYSAEAKAGNYSALADSAEYT